MEDYSSIQKEEGETRPHAKDIESVEKDLQESTFGNTSEEDISIDKVVKREPEEPQAPLPEGHGKIREGDDISMCPFMSMNNDADEKAGPKGPGGAKKWTGPAMAQAAYAPPEQASRKSSKAEGASQGHVRGCRMFTASFVETRQDERSKRLRTESLDNPLEFYITNNMFDETKLFVADPGGRRAKKRRCVALGCQITYKEEHSRGITDLDIVRPPALVKHCTAEACASVMGKATDPFGIAPDLYACLPNTNSHAVNNKVSEFISATIAKRNTCV